MARVQEATKQLEQQRKIKVNKFYRYFTQGSEKRDECALFVYFSFGQVVF